MHSSTELKRIPVNLLSVIRSVTNFTEFLTSPHFFSYILCLVLIFLVCLLYFFLFFTLLCFVFQDSWEKRGLVITKITLWDRNTLMYFNYLISHCILNKELYNSKNVAFHRYGHGFRILGNVLRCRSCSYLTNFHLGSLSWPHRLIPTLHIRIRPRRTKDL